MLCLSGEMACSPSWSSLFSNNKHRTSCDIEIRAQSADFTDPWRAAVLSYNRKAEDNVISQELTNVLGTPIQPFDKHTTKPKKSRKQGHDVNGYVDLEWCLINQKGTNKSRFFVISAHDSPYDAVLGKPDAKRYGMLQSRST
jgi:hypothetical protein